jgi:hypothetical protein
MATKPKQLNQATQKAITGPAECGFTYWGPAPGTGYVWAVDGQQNYHAVWSGTRGGERHSQHACGRMREALSAEITRLSTTAYWALSGFERDDEHRQRAITQCQIALVNPRWRCDLDGATIAHPVISTAAVESIQIEVDQ